MKVFRKIQIIALVTAMLFAFGCANDIPETNAAEQQQEATAELVPSATETMVVVVENNDGKDDEDMPYFEYRQADARAELELAEDAALPYVELIDEHWEFPLYVFMDKEGMKQYRAFVVVDTLINGAVIETTSGFIPVIFEDSERDTENPPAYTIDVETDIVDDSDNLYEGLYKDLYFPHDRNGGPAKGAIPVMVVRDEEFHTTKLYEVLPNGYKVLVYEK